MAVRNKYDVDETLETPFSLKHFKRAAVYAKRHTRKMLLALSLIHISSIAKRRMDYRRWYTRSNNSAGQV